MKTEEDQPTQPQTLQDRLRAFCEARSPFLLVFIPLALIYITTASYGLGYHIDAFTNAVTGWHIGMTGSVVLPDYEEATRPEQVGNIAWIVESPRGPVSQYPPGAALLSAPLYRLWNQPLSPAVIGGFNNPDAEPIPLGFPSLTPATLAAALASAAAMGLVAATIPYAGGSRYQAVIAGYVGGLATTMWAVASDALWQHGPASMWIALAIFLVARSHLAWAGVAFGAAVLTRPHLALVAAALGLFLIFTRRSIVPALKIGAGSFLGLGVLLWYNWWLWGKPTVTGGYGDGRIDQVLSTNFGAYFQNILGAVLDPIHGLLPYSPFLLILIPGLPKAWKNSPDWAKGAGIGGIVYLLVQLKANRFSGGEGFVGYRYPLEALTAAAVILFISYQQWVSRRRMVKWLFWVGVVIAMTLQVVV
ncbi:MAG: hypothetical protein IH918_08715 [Acidobacteria bacterium]|nr:hypothetical protein [Acidobacteriota bacterium]